MSRLPGPWGPTAGQDPRSGVEPGAGWDEEPRPAGAAPWHTRALGCAMQGAGAEDMENERGVGAERRAGPVGVLLLAGGWACVGLAVLGVALPLVPTTPFVLLAAACFVRSSPRLHRRLQADPRLGPLLRQWRAHRSVPRGAKRRAYLLVVLSFSFSLLAVEATALRVVLLVCAAGVLSFLARLRTEDLPAADEEPGRAPDLL